MAIMMSQAKSFLGLVRGVQMDAIKAQLAQPPLVLILAEDTQAAQQFAFALAGGDAPDEATARATMTVAAPAALESLAVGPSPYDLVLLIDPSVETRRNRTLQWMIANQKQTPALALYTQPLEVPDPGLPALVVTGLTDPVALRAVRARITAQLPEGRRLAWGYTFVGFRKPLTDLMVEQTARANAQFAIMADLGARIPILGGVVVTGADFLILTRNQLILAYQLAAINGRDLDDPRNVFFSAAPFFLAGLGWREVARRAVRLVPGAPFVPKALVAYGGTLVSGAIARSLANPEGVRAWLEGVQAGMQEAAQPTGRFGRLGRGATHLGSSIGGSMHAVQDRVSARLPRRGNMHRDVLNEKDARKEAIDAAPPVQVLPADDALPR